MENYYHRIERKLNNIIQKNQTRVVETLFELYPELQDQIINLCAPFTPAKKTGECEICYDDDVEIDEFTGLCECCHESSAEPREVNDWYLIGAEWASRFKENGMVVLEAMNCSWFGRTGCGQSLRQDQDLGFILKRKK